MPPLLLLLLPRPLPDFILRDQAQELLSHPGVVAVSPPRRVPYGVLGRVPDRVGARLGRRLARQMRLPGEPRAIAIFHPFQLPLAEALLERHPAAELWYGRWDRYEAAYDADERTRGRLEALHERAARTSALTFVVSEKLAELEREAGREATVVTLTAESFPAPALEGRVVAVSLGHLGHRTDWALLRAVAERMPELTLLLVGEQHTDEMPRDRDFLWCEDAPGLIWLGRRSDEQAARLILCADVGIVPFERSAFNDAGLPYRIIKYALLGRRTISPDLAGVRTWAHAVTIARTPEEWVAALRAARVEPELREWALAQTAATVNAPLHARMAALGIIDTPQTR